MNVVVFQIIFVLFIVKLLIDGVFVDLCSVEWGDIVNFVMQEVIGCVLYVMFDEVDVVIVFVQCVFQIWKMMLIGVWLCIMLKFQDFVCCNFECIVYMLMVE